MEIFDYGFPNNGLTFYKHDGPTVSTPDPADPTKNKKSHHPSASTSFLEYVEPENYKKLVRAIMSELSQLDLPVVRYVHLYILARSARPAVTGNGWILPITCVRNGMCCLTIRA